MVNIRCNASDRMRVLARPASHVHRCVPDVRRRTRRRASTVEGATPDMTGGRPAADLAGARPGARPYLELTNFRSKLDKPG